MGKKKGHGAGIEYLILKALSNAYLKALTIFYLYKWISLAIFGISSGNLNLLILKTDIPS